MSDERQCVAAMCVCGGWVMLAVLGSSKESDRETWHEVGELSAEGFQVRTPLTIEESRALPFCEHLGDCTTDPEKVRVEQLVLEGSATPETMEGTDG